MVPAKSPVLNIFLESQSLGSTFQTQFLVGAYSEEGESWESLPSSVLQPLFLFYFIFLAPSLFSFSLSELFAAWMNHRQPGSFRLLELQVPHVFTHVFIHISIHLLISPFNSALRNLINQKASFPRQKELVIKCTNTAVLVSAALRGWPLLQVERGL